MPFKGFNMNAQRSTNNNPVEGMPGAAQNKGIFTNIFNQVLGGILPPGVEFPINTPVQTQGMPAPDTHPILPDVAGGLGAGGADQGQSILDILTQLALQQNRGDPNEMARQAMAAASQQYDPQIEELKRQIGITQGNAHESQDKLGQMYGSLQKADLADIPVIDQMFNKSGQDLNAQYKQLGDQVTGQYADAQKQQMDLMNQLNIQAAAPDALKQQQNDEAFFQSQQGQSKQDTTDAMKLLQTGADNFSRQGSEIAGLEGSNRQADVMSQLQDYMTQAQGRVGDLENAKQNAYTTSLGQLSGQQSQQGQNQFNNLLQLAKFQYEMQHENQQQQQQQQQGQYKSGPLAAANFLGQNDPGEASQLNSYLLQVLQGQPFTSGQVPNPMDPTRGQQLTPEMAAQLAMQQAAQEGMSPESQQQLYLAMLAYYGRMY